MRYLSDTLMLGAAAAVIFATPARAQTPGDLSGHWQGSVAAPSGKLDIEVDLARTAEGPFKGAVSVPAHGLKGLPLRKAVVDGAKVDLQLALASGGGFRGMLSADGKAMSGEFITAQGSAPITFARTGEARFEAPPRNAALGPEMTGTWNGALDVGGKRLRLALTLANHPDGSATGVFDSVDEGLQAPVAVVQKAAALKIDVPMTGGSYAAELGDGGATLVGTFSTKGVEFPLTLTKATGD